MGKTGWNLIHNALNIVLAIWMLEEVYHNVSLFDDLRSAAPLMIALLLIFMISNLIGIPKIVGIFLLIQKLGKLIGGLLSGYSFVYFQLGQTRYIKINGKLIRRNYPKSLSETSLMMDPPDKGPDRYPYRLYMLGEALILFVFAAIGFTLYYLTGRSPVPFCFFYIPSFFSALLFFGHILPLYRNNFMTNSYQVFKVFPHDPSVKSAHYYLMKLQSLQAQADHIEDIPQQLVQAVIDLEYSNPENMIVAQLLLLKADYLLTRKERVAAIECYQAIRNSSIYQEMRMLAQFSLLLAELTGECRKEEVEKLYDDDLKKSSIMNSGLSITKRLLYAYYLLHENNESAAQEELRAFIDIVSDYQDPLIFTDEWDGIHEIEMKKYGKIITERV